MSFPFTPAIKNFTFEGLIEDFRSTISHFPDFRKGAKQSKYTMEDAVLGAFYVFFTQSPSFLSHQRAMQENKGLSNAQTLFSMTKIPTDNWIRKLLDPVPPQQVFPVFSYVFDGLKEIGQLEQFKNVNDNLLIAFDGLQYHSSQTIHCDSCSEKHHNNGNITYSHSAITPVILSPDSHTVISL
ncbi:MAG TPA: hypothetical protein DCM38_01760 [Gammaproteobacteria bacterium]|nr:hypothetical protein [Gammaproteobacteria bacterium]